jgi:spore germination protein YaaH
MKGFIVFLILLLLAVFGISQVVRHKISTDLAQPVADTVLSPSPTLVIDKNQVSKSTLFVPYWTLNDTEEIDKNYDQYIYFGIATDASGIKADNGKAQIKTFTDQVPAEKTKFLALQMIDSTMNSRVLQDQSLRKKIISQTVDLASQNGFSGVVLDLEMSAIPFNSLIDQINSFNSDISKAVKAKDMQYAITLYGDTFYRLRPFDVKTLSGDADMVMIMAYDFHKSRANPGPNFPLHGSDTYGYDMTKMGDDFLRSVPSQKVNVVFGMFGYDWAVNNAGKAIDQGKPLTYIEIKKQFLDSCSYAHCEWHRDSVSGETEIQYTDDDTQKHIVWFEDLQSVKAKQEYLKSIGVVKYAYWAYSYF